MRWVSRRASLIEHDARPPPSPPPDALVVRDRLIHCRNMYGWLVLMRQIELWDGGKGFVDVVEAGGG